jgi:glycosyltransferase involved in cell wall biosynthesis
MSSKRNKYSITYFVVSYGSESSGVAKKIQDQVKFWNQLGRDFLLYVVTDSVGASIWGNLVPESIVRIEGKGKFRYLSRTIHLFSALKLTRDIFYVRETFPIPYLKFPNGPKWIIEIQTIQENELRLRSFSRLTLYRLLRKWWNKKFDGVIYVSNELSDLLQGSFPKSTDLVISNGVDLDRFINPKSNHSMNGNDFFFMGSLDQDWQGTDQFLELAAVMPEVTFHVVGETKANYPKLSNVIFHGQLDAEQYSKIAMNCNLAFGTLNQQVTGMNEASPLKVREYLALGLPVVIRYIDTDFHGNHGFLLNLPFDSRRLVDFKDDIFKFSSDWQNRRVSKFEVEPFISAKNKENQRIMFFDRILNQNYFGILD